MASDLVEKVCDALTDHWDSADIVNGETQARIAIKVIAEWLSPEGEGLPRGADEMYVAGVLRDQLKEPPHE